MRPYQMSLLTHRILALILLVFLALHLTNHLVALWGVEAHRAFMDVARVVYRSALVEPVLILAVIAQCVTGGIQLRQKWRRWPSVWHKLQYFSGAYLLFFLINHTIAILLTLRTWLKLDTDFYVAAGTLTINPLQWFFVPYYALGVIALFVHIGSHLYFRFNIEKINRQRLGYAVISSGVIVSALIVATFSGVFFDIDLPQNVRDAYERFVR